VINTIEFRLMRQLRSASHINQRDIGIGRRVLIRTSFSECSTSSIRGARRGGCRPSTPNPQGAPTLLLRIGWPCHTLRRLRASIADPGGAAPPWLLALAHPRRTAVNADGHRIGAAPGVDLPNIGCCPKGQCQISSRLKKIFTSRFPTILVTTQLPGASTGFAPDSPLEEAVTSEPVSESPKFPARGILQGISSIRGFSARQWQQKRALNQGIISQFPTHPNREFFAALQGI
jgi:hypothetical protein